MLQPPKGGRAVCYVRRAHTHPTSRVGLAGVRQGGCRMMDVRDWQYVAEGNKHAVFRYAGADPALRATVLRACKGRSSREYMEQERAFAAAVMLPILGERCAVPCVSSALVQFCAELCRFDVFLQGIWTLVKWCQSAPAAAAEVKNARLSQRPGNQSWPASGRSCCAITASCRPRPRLRSQRRRHRPINPRVTPPLPSPPPVLPTAPPPPPPSM